MEAKESVDSSVAVGSIDHVLRDKLKQTTSLFCKSVSELLGPEVNLTISSPTTCSYATFLQNADKDAYFYAIRTSPDVGHLLMHWPTGLMGLLLKRMLGASESSEAPVKVPLTDIEFRLMSKVVGHFIRAFQVAWKEIVPLQMEIEMASSSVQSCHIYSDGLTVCVLETRFETGGRAATMRWALPADWSRRMAAIKGGRGCPATDTMVARLAETQMSATDLAGLEVGDILTTEKDVAEPIDVMVQGVVKARANLGKLDEKKAVHIVEKVEQPDKENHPPE